MNNVLIFAPKFPPNMGGAAIYYELLSNALSNLYNVSVITYHHPDKQIIEKQINGPNIYRIIPAVDNLFLYILTFPFILIVISLFYINYNLIFIQCHSSNYMILPCCIFSRIFRIPLYIDVRDFEYRRFIFKIVKNYYVIACGIKIKKKLLLEDVPEKKIFIIPVFNPKYIEKVKILKQSDFIKLIYVGELIVKKGIYYLLDTYIKLIKKLDINSKLFIIGKINNNIIQYIKKNKLEYKVFLMGQLPHKDTLNHIASSHILILPSISEGYSRVIIESFYLETLVICLKVGGNEEFLYKNKNGVLYKDDDDLYEVLCDVLLNYKKMKYKINNAKKDSIKYSYDSNKHIIYKIYSGMNDEK